MPKKLKKKSNKQFQQALQLHQRGNIAAAKEIYLQLQANDPENPEVLHYLGLVEYQTNNLASAIELISQAIKLSANEPNYYSNLAMCYTDQGEYDQAENNYRTALSKDSRLIPALIGLGSLLAKQGKYKEAEQYLSGIVKRQPNHVTANANYALTLQKLGKYKEALGFAKKAAKIDPNNAVSHSNLGNIYLDLGEFTEAQNCFRKALSLDPTYGKAFHNLARSKKFSNDDEDRELVTQSDQSVSSHNLGVDRKISFHFGLGKIYDDLKMWDKAFRHFKQANSLVTASYDAKSLQTNLNNILQCFNSQWFADHSDLGNRDASPIFVIGMPRSGTTLVEQIITSHPDVYSIGESQAIPDLANLMTSLLDSEQSYPHCIDQLGADSTKELAGKYLDIAKQSPFYQSDNRSVDKMTTNYMHLGLIVTLFPNAKIIHCTRNALDVCLSCYFQDFDGRPPFAYNLESISHFYKEYERVIDSWDQALPGKIFNIIYEDIVSDTETTIKALLEYCELPWDENCLMFYESKRQISTASNWQVKQPIYRQSLNRWENYEKHLGPLLDTLNQPSNDNELTETDNDLTSQTRTPPSSTPSVFKKVLSIFTS